MKLIKAGIFSLLLSVAGLTIAPAATFALNPLDSICTGSNASSEVCQSKNDSAGPLIGKIVNTLLFVVGMLSVVMIIVGGIYYTISAGDAGRVARAKNTITYAVVGLVVSLLAYAIVNWVFHLFK